MALTKVTGQVIKNTTDVTVGVLTVTNTLAVGGTVSIGGTLTYEDVTNVDAVGIITARSNILVGSGITLSPDGDVFATGISTFSEGFAGDVLIDDKIVHRGDTDTAIRFADTDTITAETAGQERFRIASNGSLIHTAATNRSLSLVATANATDAGIKIAFFGANRYDANEEFASIKGLLKGNNGGSGNKQNGALQFVVGAASSTHTMAQNGRVGINTDIPRTKLHVFLDRSGFSSGGTYGDLTVENSSDSTIQLLAPSTQSTNIHFGDESNGMVGRIGYAHTDNSMQFTTGNDERVRINSDGRLLIGTQAARNVAGGTNDLLQVESSGGGAGISVIRNSNNTSPPTLDLGKSRGYPNTIVQSGDKLGLISFAGADGTDLASVGAQISGEVDGTPGENDMPGRLVFKVTSDGSSSPTERVKITSTYMTVTTIGSDSGIRLVDGSNSGGSPSLEIMSKRSDGNVNTAFSSNIFLGRNRTDQKIVTDTFLGTIAFGGNHTDGTEGNISYAAAITARASGDFNSKSDMPTDLVFTTGTSGTDRTGEAAGQSNVGTEHARITSSGDLRIGQSSTSTPSNSGTTGLALRNNGNVHFSAGAFEALNLNRTNTGDIQIFQRNGLVKGQIDINASRVAYETTSDYRLKENITTLSNGIIRLKTLKPSRFNFKEDPNNTIDGFIAHELQTVIPQAVSGTKDEVDSEGKPKYQGADTSCIVPLLTAALQEAVAKIEVLESEVAALKSS